MPLPKPRKYAIYPAVGIARLGTSAVLNSYLGPEVPNPDFVPGPLFPGRHRDPAGNIRRQGALFRVYRVTWRRYRDGWVPRRATEVTGAPGFTFRWTVRVANFKSFTSATTPTTKGSPNRIQNRASKEIGGVSQIADLRGDKQNLLLGQITTDTVGRLVYFAGIGECRNVGGTATPSDLFNKGWFDDVCDGSVDCLVDDGSGAPEPAERAWVVTGAPAYAHQIGHLVTLHDVAETVAISQNRLPRPAKPSVVRHIAPVLRATDRQKWVTDAVTRSSEGEHDNPFDPEELLRKPGSPNALDAQDHKSRRLIIAHRLRNPVTVHASDRKSPFLPHWYPVDAAGQVENRPSEALTRATHAPEPRQMPRQIGLPFTLEQYKRFQQWDDGTVAWDHPDSRPRPVTLDQIKLGVDQIDALNRAHLGSMIGGSTMPGIEVGWKALEPDSWGNAFRPADTLEPGDLTFSLSVPWPADFLSCYYQDVTNAGDTRRNDWWPAARPISVKPAGGTFAEWDRGVGAGDPEWWKSRGFLARNAAGNAFEEVEKP